RSLEVSLAGTSLLDRCKVAIAPAEQRAFREQVQAFLDACPSAEERGNDPVFRQQCLRELRAARSAGLLTAERLDPNALARQAGSFVRFGDPQALLNAEWASLGLMAGALREFGHVSLAALIERRPPDGPALLVLAVRYFFRREVEADEKLAR